MKKLALLLLVFIACSTLLPAQVIDFCTAINPQGQCLDHPRKFYIPHKKTADIYAVVRLLEPVGATKVEYKIYYVNSYQDEFYMTSLYQEVKPEMTSFWKKIAFSEQLSYKIYVYTDSNKLLTSAPIFVEVDYRY